METLRQKQARFAKQLGEFLTWIFTQGYEVTFGEVYRTPEQAKINAAKGIGITNSLHTLRLAVDLNLFKDGIWLTKSEDFTPLGIKWESMAIDNRWGGRFAKPDGNHFSIEHNGVK